MELYFVRACFAAGHSRALNYFPTGKLILSHPHLRAGRKERHVVLDMVVSVRTVASRSGTNA